MDLQTSDALRALHDELVHLKESHPTGGDLLPNCFRDMQGEFLDYIPRQMLKTRFPVLEESLNPVRKMQGGYITAAFDNTFGPLSYVAARCICSTIDIQTQFIRSVDEGDSLTITARVVSRGSSTMHLSGEAVNAKGKLVATCTANMVVQRTPQ
jgi:uncharacterized protein (TIGR00369 family)